jgi:hypothetical protein
MMPRLFVSLVVLVCCVSLAIAAEEKRVEGSGFQQNDIHSPRYDASCGLPKLPGGDQGFFSSIQLG